MYTERGAEWSRERRRYTERKNKLMCVLVLALCLCCEAAQAHTMQHSTDSDNPLILYIDYLHIHLLFYCILFQRNVFETKINKLYKRNREKGIHDPSEKNLLREFFRIKSDKHEEETISDDILLIEDSWLNIFWLH